MIKTTVLIFSILSCLNCLVYGQTEKVTQETDTRLVKVKVLYRSLNFLVMGDWGRHGEQHQKRVAAQMNNAAIAINASFNLITGDNFYPKGVASEYDPSWQSSFENVYNQHALFNDWYVSLGNHDYKTNPDAEVAYSKISARWHMPARYYSFTKTLPDSGTVEFFVIDTSPFQKDYYKDEEYGPHIIGNDTAAQKNGWRMLCKKAKLPGNLW